MNYIPGYNEAQAYTSQEREELPLGGHICKILKARVDKLDNGSEVLVLAFDIAEGSSSDGFYERQFERAKEYDPNTAKWKGTFRQFVPKGDGSDKDKKTMGFFKGLTTSIEASNPGYKFDFDEKKLVGKLFGGVFGRKEYDYMGKRGFFTQCTYIRSTKNIFDAAIPEDKLLPQSSSYSANTVEDISDDDLPF